MVLWWSRRRRAESYACGALRRDWEEYWGDQESSPWKAISEELLQLEWAADRRAIAMGRSARRWGGLHNALGIPATVLASLAAATAFADNPLVAAWLAAGAGVLAALQTFLRPDEQARKAREQLPEFEDFYQRVRMVRRVWLLDVHRRFLAAGAGGDADAQAQLFTDAQGSLAELGTRSYELARQLGKQEVGGHASSAASD